MQTILVTGGAGFIGSNFIEYFLDKYCDYKIINLDLLTYAGNLENLTSITNNINYEFIQGDICNRNLIEGLFNKFNVKHIIHFAAESHVDNSISNPDVFIQTNINGTFTLLDVAYKYWMGAPFINKSNYKDSRFHHISTDEVYGTLGETGKFSEVTPYSPNSPYSASKASSDMIVRSYHHTYGMNTVVTNCSNNYGANQHSEKLIPTIIRNALQNKPIPIYGDGSNVRDWLYVLDHCKAIDLVFHQGKSGETYNVGGDNELNNNHVVNLVCETLDELKPKDNSYKKQISFVQDRAGHDKRYAIDFTKLHSKLGWSPEETFKTGILKTVRWYLAKY